MSTAGRQATTRDEAPARGAGPHFPIRRGLLSRTVGHVHAVDGVSLTIGHGETLRLVGESGCGKSTAGKNIVGSPTAVTVRLRGDDITQLSDGQMRPYRREM